jgi:hypothetical protein
VGLAFAAGYIIGSKPDTYVVVYYKGTNDAWDGYGGAVVYTKARQLPEVREDQSGGQNDRMTLQMLLACNCLCYIATVCPFIYKMFVQSQMLVLNSGAAPGVGLVQF